MYDRILLSNGYLRAEISTLGAELKSIQKDGKEWLWQGDPDFWEHSAPILFPICGSLRNNRYTHMGKEYYLKHHGYAAESVFEIESKTQNRAVFLLRSCAESLKCYPFHYELRVIYELCESSLKVIYKVNNLSDNEMFFSIGAHEGWNTPGGFENYIIEFEKDEALLHTILDGILLTHDTVSIGKRSIKLSYDYFTEDALVFLGLKSRSVKLKNIISDECIKVTFKGFNNVLLWTVPEADFICIEPWCGMPDYSDFHGDISEKAGVIKLMPHQKCIREHSINLI